MLRAKFKKKNHGLSGHLDPCSNKNTMNKTGTEGLPAD